MKTGPLHNQLCLEHKSCPVLSTPQWFPLNKIHQAIGPQPLSHLIHSLLSSLDSATLAFWSFFEQTKVLFTGSLPVLLALDLGFPSPSRATLSSASLRFTLPVTVLSFKDLLENLIERKLFLSFSQLLIFFSLTFIICDSIIHLFIFIPIPHQIPYKNISSMRQDHISLLVP